jgi:hypothetical protein
MQTYSMICLCGHEMKTQADSREAAVGKMQEEMTQAALNKHMKEYHRPDDAKPSLAEAHRQIAQNLQEVTPAIA